MFLNFCEKEIDFKILKTISFFLRHRHPPIAVIKMMKSKKYFVVIRLRANLRDRAKIKNNGFFS